jgi:MFS family permease
MDRSRMNQHPENAPAKATVDAGRQDDRPENWREALMSLIASRIALIQLEARDAARQRARRVIGMIVAVICLFFTWALLLAGGIAAISSATGCPWHWLAIGAAALHLLLAMLLLKAGPADPATPAFPLTRAEFQKDREWIENFQKKPKSNA